MNWKISYPTLMLSLACGTAALASETLYVATNGNDSWSGTIAAPNAEKTDGPFATLERARDEIRKHKAAGNLKGETTVCVRDGMYALAQTLKLGPQDSGEPNSPVVYRAYQNEKPIVIGGRTLTGFVPHKGEILKTDVSGQGFKGIVFHQLFFDGKRQHVARYPNFDPQNPYGGGWAYADGKPCPMYGERPGEDKHSFQCKPNDLHNWSRPEDGEVFVFPRYNWWNNIVRIKSIDRETRTITLKNDCSYAIRPTDRYYVQNLLEELDAPGEWYLDKSDSTLYFWPPAPLQGKAVYAPTMRTLVDLAAGTSNITFRGFTFECCEGTAINLVNTTNCMVTASVIRNVGDYSGSGVSINGGTNNGVAGNDIYEIGSNGIHLGGGDRITLTPANNYADNNYIHHVGVFYKQGVGVSMSGCGNRASHNFIHDGPRMGIMFGGNNLVIEYNHIRHMNLETEDTGAVYTGGRDWIGSRGSVIRYNYFHDMLGYGQQDGKWVSPHFAWGVYLDDNTGGVDVIGNIVTHCSRACIHLHNGRDNLIENNVFVEGRLQQAEYGGWTSSSRMWLDHYPTMVKGYESVASQPAWKNMRNMQLHPSQAILPDGKVMTGNQFFRNILYSLNPKAKLYQMRNVPFDHNQFDYNLVFHAGQPLLTGLLKVKPEVGPNIAPNASFEDGAVGELPKDWSWQAHPTPTTKAAITDQQPHAGKQALCIEGSSAKDAAGKPKSVQIKSVEIAAKPGQTYRLTAWLKSDRAGAKAGLVAQAWKANSYSWQKELTAVVGTEWKPFELIFKFPAEGEQGYNAAMKSFWLRLDQREETGALFVDDLALNEATPLDEWESWQATGMDQHSLVADPHFVAPEKQDYRLQADSPAFKLGFKAIPVEKIGPYKDELRASWPIVEAEGAREHPLSAQTEK